MLRHTGARGFRCPSTRTSRRWLMAFFAILIGVFLVPAAPVTAATDGDLTISGHGWGHGRGMGQYGALGYAVDHGWTYDHILGHFYGGTTVGNVGNPEMSVELLALNGKPLVVTASQIRIVDAAGNGAVDLGTAARFTLQGNGSVTVERGTGCVSSWRQVSGTFTGNNIRVSAPGEGASLDSLLRVCEATGERAYRGSLSVVNHLGTQMTINHLPTESYLRGVVPRESPASWGSAGGGRGIEALKAQAVAARSYALSSSRATGAKTCDTTACQVYGGAGVKTSSWTALESALTDQAIAATAGEVRMIGTAVARTEFSSSTGGYTAGGVFPAVLDAGDAISANPNKTWSTSMSMSTVASRLGTGAIRSITVTGRNGLGVDGGRVTEVTVITTGGQTVRFTGNQVRSALGLKSDWFVLSGATDAAATAVVRALYQDILGREPDPSGLETWTRSIAQTGDARNVARGIVMSTERLQAFIRTEYRAALRREPEPAGLTHWTAYMQAGTSVPELRIYIYASDEAMLNIGHGDLNRWVDGVYRGILGRSAGASEQAVWADVARVQGRPVVVRSIAMSDEAGLRRLTSYYRTMLGRSPDPSGISTFLPMMRGNGDFLLPIEIGGSPEYWLRAQTR